MHRVVVILIYSFLALTGLLGNIWVICTVVGQFFLARRTHHYPRRYHQSWSSSMQTSAHLYLLLLSIADLISTAAVPLLDVDVAQSQWPFGPLACKLLFTFEGANKSLTPLVLMALSVDRYVAVCHGSRHRLRQWRYATGVSACCIGVSLLFILPVTFEASVTSLWDSNEQEHVKCTVVLTPLFDLLHITVCFILPLLAICCVYTAILRKLYQHMAKAKEGGCTSKIPVSRLVKSSVMVVVFYFICWTPYWAHRLVNMLASGAGHTMPIHSEEPAVTGHISWLKQMFDQSDTAVNLTSMLEEMNIFQLIQLHDELVREEKIAPFSSSFPSVLQHQHPPPALQQQERSYMIHMLEMYLLHALPYCQCAFNWLFYSFLNRNLRLQLHHQHARHTFTQTERSPNHQANGAALTVNGRPTAVVRRRSEPLPPSVGHKVESMDEQQLSPDTRKDWRTGPNRAALMPQGCMSRRMSKSDYNLFFPAPSITASTAITEVSKACEQCQEEEEDEERISMSPCRMHDDPHHPRTPSPLALLLPAGKVESATDVV